MFEWKDQYSVSIEEIDRQHQRLFEIGAKIHEITLLDSRFDYYDQIIAVLDELKEYTVFHFDFEEKLLEQHGYTQLEQQHFEHVFFIKKLEKIGRKDIDGMQTETAEEIARFIADWIAGHILQSDMKYKEYLNSIEIF